MKERIYKGNLKKDLEKVNEVSKRDYKKYLKKGMLPYLLTYGTCILGAIFTTGKANVFFRVSFIVLKEPILLMLISLTSLASIMHAEYKLQKRKEEFQSEIDKIESLKEDLNIKDIEIDKTKLVKNDNNDIVVKQGFNVTTNNLKKEYLLAVKDYVTKLYMSENAIERNKLKEYKREK